MKRLILTGEIGTGKTTLIQRILGTHACRAGGFITRRVFENGILQSYELAPAAALADSDIKGQSFLMFSPTPVRNDTVFSGSGTQLLKAALQAPYAVADEFGGLELLVEPFYEQLLALLRSDVPVIGVMKTPQAFHALSEKVPLGNDYTAKALELYTLLQNDPETVLLPIPRWNDPYAIKTVQTWTDAYVRRE